MRSSYGEFKQRAINLRKSGKTYGEINRMLRRNVPKSTLSLWFKNLVLSEKKIGKIEKAKQRKIVKSRLIAVAAKRSKHGEYLKSITNRMQYLKKIIKNKDVAKIVLAMLYLSEGSKTEWGSLVFGNSNPATIELFLRLLRFCYNIDESKFRCTVQCRADQNTRGLESFWSRTTKIPLSRFYQTRVDPRTIGKPSLKTDYKGVCRIDYFSADIFNEIKSVISVVSGGR